MTTTLQSFRGVRTEEGVKPFYAVAVNPSLACCVPAVLKERIKSLREGPHAPPAGVPEATWKEAVTDLSRRAVNAMAAANLANPGCVYTRDETVANLVLLSLMSAYNSGEDAAWAAESLRRIALPRRHYAQMSRQPRHSVLTEDRLSVARMVYADVMVVRQFCQALRKRGRVKRNVLSDALDEFPDLKGVPPDMIERICGSVVDVDRKLAAEARHIYYRDRKRHGSREALKQVEYSFRGMSLGLKVVDGKLVTMQRNPNPQEVVAELIARETGHKATAVRKEIKRLGLTPSRHP